MKRNAATVQGYNLRDSLVAGTECLPAEWRQQVLGLKPMRLAVHRNTTEIQKYIPIVQKTTSAPQHTETMAIYQTTSAPQHTADDFSSTAYSRRLQLHSIQQTTSAPQHSHSIQQSQLSSRQCQLHSIQLHQLSSRLLQLHGIQHTAYSR